MFSVLILLNWNAAILTTEIGIAPQRTTSKQVHIPCPIYHLFSSTFGYWARRGLKHLRTLIKSRFLKILNLQVNYGVTWHDRDKPTVYAEKFSNKERVH